jgi:hypothetical protein
VADPVERPEDLYAVDLGDFVVARNGLAARLRADGDRDAATAVKAMRKPPRAAWALNVLARAEPEVVAQALDAAQRVAESISDGGDELRTAQRDYTRAVTATVDAAAQRAGLSGDALLEQMRATVLAAGADPDGEVASNLRAGTLATDAPAPGFSFAGMDLAADVAPTAPRHPRRPATRVETGAAPIDDAAAAAETARVAEAAASEDAAAEEAAAAARAAKAAAAAAERRRARERTRLAREIDRRAQRVARLDEVAATAEAAALEARAAATEATEELRTAEARLEELERRDD